MSEFKFACPICGQHIRCDSTKSGSQMDCPTCFRKIVVPQAPEGGNSNLILTASQAGTRPLPSTPGADAPMAPARKKFPFATVAMIVVLGAAVAGAVVFRDKLFKPQTPKVVTKPPAPKVVAPVAPVVPMENDTNWTLHLAGTKIPETPAAGRVNGRGFALDRATIKGGTLDLRQGPKWPPDVGVSVYLFANQSEDLAGQSITIEPGRANPPKAVLRWKDEQQQAVTQNIYEGYALRLEFGPMTGGRLPGKIYFCGPDEAKSWVAGTFLADIRRPPPPRPKNSGQ